MGTAGRRNDESEVELVMADWMWMDVYVRMRSIHTCNYLCLCSSGSIRVHCNAMQSATSIFTPICADHC